MNNYGRSMSCTRAQATADGCIDTLCTTSTIDDFLARQTKKVLVYPNPTTDYLIFEIDEDVRDVHVEIFDLHGRLLQGEGLRAGTQALMLKDGLFSAFMYGDL